MNFVEFWPLNFLSNLFLSLSFWLNCRKLSWLLSLILLIDWTTLKVPFTVMILPFKLYTRRFITANADRVLVGGWIVWWKKRIAVSDLWLIELDCPTALLTTDFQSKFFLYSERLSLFENTVVANRLHYSLLVGVIGQVNFELLVSQQYSSDLLSLIDTV